MDALPTPVQPGADASALTRAEQDCLLALFRLQAYRAGQDQERPVANGDLARALGVAAPTATVALQRLAKLGLVDHQPYHGVRLSPAGLRLGGLALRRHRLIETFLVRTLGVEWTQVHEEAERLEHGISAALLERIDAHLGHPANDPHGDPIPDRDGRLVHGPERPLSGFASGDALVLVRILGHDQATFAFLDRHRLAPGARLVLRATAPEAGVLTVAVGDGTPLTIATTLAVRLLCRPVTAGDATPAD